MSARDAILARLRAAPAGAAAPLPDVGAWYAARRASSGAATAIARFRANIEAAHAEVHDVDAASWPAQLIEIAARKGVRTLLYAPRTAHGRRLDTLPSAAPHLIAYDRPASAWKRDFFDGVDAALTAARSGIAATGSLVLRPDADEPRLMSLVPPVHFVLLDAGAIHADLHAAMTAERWTQGMPTNMLVVSGPSKTADIQQTLAYGAHGPRELVVLLRHGAAS